MQQPDLGAWLDGLALPAHAALLRELTDRVSADARFVWLELGCSLPAGRGDTWSDLDLGLGVRGDVEAARPAVAALLADLGPTLVLHAHDWGGVPRWWVVYRSGLQVDLVALAADGRPGRAPDSVALVDRDGRLAHEFRPSISEAAPGDVEGWALDGWEALANVAKYLARGSVHEALDQLHRARTALLRTQAAAEGVRYPAFGLTSLLDDDRAALPAGLDATYAIADATSVRAAASACADLLDTVTARTRTAVPPALTAHVRALLLWRPGAPAPIVYP